MTLDEIIKRYEVYASGISLFSPSVTIHAPAILTLAREVKELKESLSRIGRKGEAMTEPRTLKEVYKRYGYWAVVFIILLWPLFGWNEL